jgi:RecB family exonuclease
MDANKYSRELAFPPKADPPTAEDSRGFALKDAWERLKELVASIKPDKDYKCNRCELKPYCKWCPAKGWLYNRIFTSCDSESRRWAEDRKQVLLNC